MNEDISDEDEIVMMVSKESSAKTSKRSQITR